MNSRAQMLAAIQQSQPAPVPLPFILPPAAPADLAASFEQQLVRNGAQVVRVQHAAQIQQYLNQHFSQQDRWVCTVPMLNPDGSSPQQQAGGHELADVTLAVCSGSLGVAENGAIWVDERQLPHRALPFLCQHLALVLDESTLVATLHDAYRLLLPGSFDYGVFIAGPSKTADIEQSLVIGAHGSRSLYVFLQSSTTPMV